MKKTVLISITVILLFSTIFLVGCNNDSDPRDGTYIFHSATNLNSGVIVNDTANLSDFGLGGGGTGTIGNLSHRIYVVGNGRIRAYLGQSRIVEHNSVFVGDLIVLEYTLGVTLFVIHFARI